MSGGDAPIVDRALAMAAARRRREEQLSQMEPEARMDAYRAGKLSLFDCLAWAALFPQEPPRAACGEYMFIAVRTAEWLEAESPTPERRAPPGREL